MSYHGSPCHTMKCFGDQRRFGHFDRVLTSCKKSYEWATAFVYSGCIFNREAPQPMGRLVV